MTSASRSAIVFTVALATTPLVAQEMNEAIKIRVINSSDAMQLTETGKQEAQKIEALGKELKETLDNKEKLLRETVNSLQAKATTLSPAAREKEESKIITMRNDLQSTGQASDEQYKHAVQRATEKLSKEIELAVTKIAQEQDLDLVLDLYTGRPVYASNKIIITDDIIKAMDENTAKAKKTASKKPEETKTATPSTKTKSS